MRVEAHIAIIVTCGKCLYSADLEDYDSTSIPEAAENAKLIECPVCAEFFDKYGEEIPS